MYYLQIFYTVLMIEICHRLNTINRNTYFFYFNTYLRKVNNANLVTISNPSNTFSLYSFTNLFSLVFALISLNKILQSFTLCK